VAQSRRKFSPQFKAEAVQFVIETGRPIAEIARELEINEGTLGNWVNEWKRSNPEPGKALTPVERARVAEMEDEIRRLRMENEFLNRAAARPSRFRWLAAVRRSPCATPSAQRSARPSPLAAGRS
jgi:transposase-like protein